ncbi:MAG: DUF1795 domain-containing protein [Clostridiales bacterium]|nr:DUF1795 domain-containing protein [Clostridiales bacterium]
MMKKFFSVFVALVLALLPVVSMAETAEYLTYTHPDGQYSFMYPSNWIVLSEENIEYILTVAAKQGDAQLAQMAETYGPTIRQSGMVILLSETGMTNVNVAFTNVGMRASDEVLLTLAPAMMSQLSTVAENIQFIEEGTIIDLGDKNGMMLEYVYELSGIQMHGIQVYVSGAADMYTFTYTCVDADELEATAEDFGFMLGSLTAK